MPRVLFDIDFSNQSFNNTADESDWILSPINSRYAPVNAQYVEVDTNTYALKCKSGAVPTICFVSQKQREITEYQIDCTLLMVQIIISVHGLIQPICTNTL